MTQTTEAYQFNRHGVCQNPKIVVKFGERLGAACIIVKVCERNGNFGYGYESRAKHRGQFAPAMVLDDKYPTEKDAVRAACRDILRNLRREDNPYQKDLESYLANMDSTLF